MSFTYVHFHGQTRFPSQRMIYNGCTKDKSQLTPAKQPDASYEPTEHKVHQRRTQCTLKTKQLE